MSLVTWSPTDKGSGVTLSNSNMTATIAGNASQSIRATVGKSSGKWYWEFKVDKADTTILGISDISRPVNAWYLSRGYVHWTGQKISVATTSNYGVIYTTGDIIGVALNLVDGIIEFYKNGVSQGIAFNDILSLGEVFPSLGHGTTSGNACAITVNFGATPFQYEIPNGYLPYDIENADWLIENKYLLKSNSIISTINQNGDIVQTDLVEPLIKTNFDEYGFFNLDLLINKDLIDTELLISLKENYEIIPKMAIQALPNPQLVLPKDDIVFRMLSKIENFQMVANPVNTQNIKIIFSIDSGNTWMTYNKDTLLFENINMSNLEDIKNSGIDIETFNSLGNMWNEVVVNSKIRFGYYLDIDNLNNVAQVDRLDVTIYIIGDWKSTDDYRYGYGNEKIYIQLYKDGSYKINYCE